MDIHEPYLHTLSELKPSSGSHTCQALPVWIIFKPVITECFQSNHPFHRHGFQLNKKAKFCDSGNCPRKDISCPLAQKQAGKATGNLTLCLGRDPFPCIALIGECKQFSSRYDRLIRTQRMMQCSVYKQIGISPDGRGKMAVTG